MIKLGISPLRSKNAWPEPEFFLSKNDPNVNTSSVGRFEDVPKKIGKNNLVRKTESQTHFRLPIRVRFEACVKLKNTKNIYSTATFIFELLDVFRFCPTKWLIFTTTGQVCVGCKGGVPIVGFFSWEFHTSVALVDIVQNPNLCQRSWKSPLKNSIEKESFWKRFDGLKICKFDSSGTMGFCLSAKIKFSSRFSKPDSNPTPPQLNILKSENPINSVKLKSNSTRLELYFWNPKCLPNLNSKSGCRSKLNGLKFSQQIFFRSIWPVPSFIRMPKLLFQFQFSII